MHRATLHHLVPVQKFGTPLSARVEEVLGAEQQGQKEADGTDHDVGDTDERVLAAHLAQGAQSEALACVEAIHFKVAVDLEVNGLVLLEVAVNLAVELAEGGEPGGAHPHDEVLVGDAVDGRDLIGVGLVQVLRAVVVRVEKAVQLAIGGNAIGRVALRSLQTQQLGAVGVVDRVIRGGNGLILKAGHLLEAGAVRGPRDAALIHSVAGLSQGDDVGEERVGHQAAGVQKLGSVLHERVAVKVHTAFSKVLQRTCHNIAINFARYVQYTRMHKLTFPSN